MSEITDLMQHEMKPKYELGDTVNVYKSIDTYTVDFVGVINMISPMYDTFAYGIVVGDIGTVQVECNLRKRYTHISPSGLKMFESNRDEFYMKYIARYKPPSIPQTKPMSVGSSFDAMAKAYINNTLAKGHELDPKYQLEALFEAQVEEQNREWARPAGEHCYQQYCSSGAMAALMLEIAQGDAEPQYEFDVKGLVTSDDSTSSSSDKVVPLAGKPDLYYKNKHNLHIITDWKVNGFCARSAASPKPGYIMVRDGWKNAKPSRNNNCAHKDAMISTVKGVQVNLACNLEDVDRDWATQISCYAWLMGEEVGGQFLACIEQLSCSPSGVEDKPMVRVANFRSFISKQFQEEAYQRFYSCWCAIRTGNFYPELPRYENDLKCLEMEKMAQTLNPTGDDNQDWFNNMNRRH